MARVNEVYLCLGRMPLQQYHTLHTNTYDIVIRMHLVKGDMYIKRKVNQGNKTVAIFDSHDLKILLVVHQRTILSHGVNVANVV